MVHLECPSGTGPQASSMMRASARPSSIQDECVDKNIEINSAEGFFLSRSLGELTIAYSKKFLKDKENIK